MFKRLSIILAIALAAGGVFALLIYLGGDPTPRIDPTESMTLEPISPDQQQIPTGDLTQPIKEVQGYLVRLPDDSGRVMEVFGKTVTPLPHGLSQFEYPGFRFIHSPSQVIEILAEAGTIEAPENIPQTGELTGPVVVSIYENRQGEPVALGQDSPDIQLRIFMTGAHFNVAAGQIESDGPIHLTGPMVDFRGEGLRASFSEKHNRIELLEIEKGKQLRFKRDAMKQQNGRSPETAATQPASTTPDQPRPPVDAQYYRARLDRRLRIHADHWQFDAQWLDLFFGLQAVDKGDLGETGGVPSTQPQPDSAAESVVPAEDNSPMAQTQWDYENTIIPVEQTLAPIDEKDVVIHWAGAMVIEPIGQKPEQLQGPQDVLMQMTGRPVRITRFYDEAIGETIWTHTLEYQGLAKKLVLAGTDQWPMMINSPKMGAITGQSLAVDLENLTGEIIGRGKLVAYDRDRRPPTDTPAATANMPDDNGELALTWTDGVDLTFFQRMAGENNAPTGEIHSLKDATFHGDIRVEHSRFNMTAHENLAIKLTPPDADDQTLHSIEAQGDVLIEAVTGADDQPLTFKAGQMTVDVARHKDEIVPSRLLASQKVKAFLPGQQLSAGNLDLVFAMPAAPSQNENSPITGPMTPPATTQPTTQPAETQAATQPTTQPVTPERLNEQFDFAVASMTASDSVNIKIADKNIAIAAERLTYDQVTDQFEFTGSEQADVVIQSATGQMVGQHIVFGQTNQSVQVIGPGNAAFQSEAATPPDDADDLQLPDNRVAIAWQRSMHFNPQQEMAEFYGQVKADMASGTNTSTITADQELAITFDLDSFNAQNDKTGEQAQADPPPLNDTAAVRKFSAMGNVTLQASHYADHIDGTLADRLLLTGPNLTFDGLGGKQQIQILGPGNLLIEQFQANAAAEKTLPKENTPKDRQTKSLQVMPTTFGGNGQTLFIWDGSLTVDALYNQIWFDQNVCMIHRPADSGEVLQLESRHLIADLKQTGGLGALAAGAESQPEIVAIYADAAPDQRLRILWDEYEIYGDHLVYTEAEKVLKLKADPPKRVDIHSPQQAFSYQQINWNIQTGEVVGLQPGIGEFNPNQ